MIDVIAIDGSAVPRRRTDTTMGTRIKKPRCVLCTATLTPTESAKIWLHPASAACGVGVADDQGVSLDETYFLADDGQVYLTDKAFAEQQAAEAMAATEAARDSIFVIGLGQGQDTPTESAWTSSKLATQRLYEAHGLEPLGGASGTLGWSSVSMFQRCPHLWNINYGPRGRRNRKQPDRPAGEALEVGDLVHTLLAIYYQRIITPDYSLEPIAAVEFLKAQAVTPTHIDEAVRVFTAYLNWWDDERTYMTPLAVEHLVVDPKTGRSCRWDLVIRLDRPYEGLLPGVYVVNSKTTSRDTSTGRVKWRNDGQILGEWDLYHQLHYDRRWGAARGSMINLMIRTKDIKCDRIWAVPPKEVVRDHQRTMSYWAAQMDVAKASGYFPRARAACETKFGGLCEEFNNCAGLDPSSEDAL